MGAHSKQPGSSEIIRSDTVAGNKRNSKLRIWFGMVATLLVLASVGLVTQRVLAISNVGPDNGEFGGENMYYELSNTQYVNSTSMAVPVYSPTKPVGPVVVSISYFPDPGAAGVITVEGIGGNPGGISEPVAAFALDPNTGYYVAILNASIGGAQADPNYRMFRMTVAAPRIIGYSSANTNHFAVGGANRCDGGGDVSGCGRYFNWRLPFAPACNQASGNASVSIFDADDVDPGAGTIFGNFGVQPSPFSVQIWDTTTNTAASGVYNPASSPGGWGSGQTKTITFGFTQFHKYQARLSGVYANNVIQFKLPFDSINTRVSCPTGNITTSVAAGCSQIRGYMYDRDNPALPMQLYYYVNPPAGTPSIYPVPPAPAPAGWRGPGLANLANPPGTPAGVPANHGFSIAIPAGVSASNYNGEWAPNTYWIYAKSSGGTNVTRVDTLAVPTCGKVTCTAAMTTLSGNIGVGAPENFIVWVDVSGASSKPPGATFSVNITGPANQAFAPGVASPPPGVLPGNVTSTNMTFTPLLAGVYTPHWSYYGVNCTGAPVTASYRPYFSVLGGDVASGLTNNSGATACTQLTTGSAAGTAAIVRSWNYDNTNPAGNYYGAGTQDGAFALGQISSFISGLNPLAIPTVVSAVQTSLVNPYDVSFSKTVGVNVAQAKYGGSFGQYGYCLDDYVGLAQNRPGVQSPGGVNFDVTGKNGTFKFAGDVTLTGTLAAGQALSVAATGSVIINASATGMGYPVGAATTDQIPYFEVLAGNSIYVNHGVTNLYGFYDAQGGTFATCANGFAETTDYDTCKNPLTIDGAVSANTVHFERTYGNLNPVAGLPGAASPAEIVRSSPALWVGAMGACAVDSSFCAANGFPYDAITALPPVL